MTTKAIKPKKSPSTLKDKLAKGAAEIRKLTAKKEPKKKKAGDNGEAPDALADVLPPIGETNLSAPEIMSERVRMAADNHSLTLDPQTTAAEYLAIFDNFVGLGESVQFLIGDVINEGEKLESFGGKYEAAMASTGRPISTLKGYAYTSRKVAPELRSIHAELKYSHVKEIAAVPKLEDQRQILQEAAKKLSSGKKVSTTEIRKKADKFKPKKPAKKGKPEKEKADKPALEMSGEQQALYDNTLAAAQNLEEFCGKELKEFVMKISFDARKALLRYLTPIANLCTRIEKSLES